MKASLLVALLALGSLPGAHAQTTLLTETFDTDGEGSRYTSSTFDDGGSDFFERLTANPDPRFLSGFGFTAPQGGGYWGSEDVDEGGAPNPLGDHGIVRLNDLNVSGFTALKVRIFLAATSTTRFDIGDVLEVQYAMDGDSGGTNLLAGVYTTIGRFIGNAPDIFGSVEMRQDSDLDGVVNGDPQDAASPILTPSMTEYVFDVPVTGSSLSVQVRVEQNGGSEELAFDHIRISGDVAVTDPPVLAGIEGSSVMYTEGDPATQVTNTLTVQDPDSNIESATVRITAGLHPTEDVLAIGTPPGGAAVNYNPATGVLTITGSGTPSTYQSALRSVTYQNTDGVNPSTAIRTVQFQVNDGTNNSNFQTRNVQITGTIGTGTIPHLEDFNVDGEGATYTSSTYRSGDDFFERSTTNPAPSHGAPITPTPPQGGAFWAAEDVDSAGNPLADHGIVRLQNLNAAGLSNLEISVFLAQTGSTFDLNDKIEVQYAFDGDIPVNPTDLATGTYTTIGRFVGDTVDQFGDGPLRQDSDLDGAVNGDPDDAGSPALGNTMTEYTFSIPATGSALSVQIRVGQNGGTEELAFDHIRVTGDAVVGTPPTLAAIEGTAISYDEGDPATQVTGTLTVSDPDATQIASATVQISGNFDAAEDVLADNGSVPAGISVGPFNPGTGTLALTGTATPADYQTALRAVTYQNTDAVNPSVGSRTVRFQAVDGDGNPSNFASRNILIVPNIDPGSVPLVEDFETDGNGERYIAGSFNTGALESFFERVTANPDPRHDVAGFAGFTFTPPQGGAYWAGEDIENAANPLGDHGIVRLRDLDVTGLSGIKVRLHLAESAPNAEGPDDKIEIQFAMDGNTGGADLTAGTYTTIGRFVPDSPDEFTTGPMTLDRDLDGVTFGDAVDDAPAAPLSQTMQEFEFDIPATGNLLSVQVRVQQNGGSEELAIDHITVVAPLAGPLVVTTDVDEDDGNPGPLSGAGTSLREAIEAANLAPGVDAIEFSDGSGGTVNFFDGSAETIAIAGLGQLSVTDDLTINGPGSNRVTIDGGNTVRGLDISNSVTDLDFSGFTVANGDAGAANGGGINLSADTGTFTFSDLQITGNNCTNFGGGININSNTGSFTFTSSTFEGNSLTGFAGGGGLSFQTGSGSLVIRDSTFHDNTSAGGGAIFTARGTTHLINSTLSGNTSGNAGGDVGGGGLLIEGGTTVTVTNTTIVDNTSGLNGGGIAGAATVNNTIVAGNNAPSNPDVSGSFTSNGFNFIGDPGASTGFGADKTFASTGTVLEEVLDPVLKDFGGPTLVHRLVLDSPAIDMGGTPDAVDENLAPLANDQRGPGFPRVQGPSVDIGAFETAPPAVVTTTADSGPGSLREAVANTPNGGFVTFDPSLDGGTITLTGGQISVSNGLDIDASALTRGITISGGGTSRVLFVSSSSPATLRKLIIADGLEGVGAGILCSGNLTLEECHLARNTASSLGGGIYQSAGTLDIRRSTLSGNTSASGGGAIRSIGTSTVLIVTNSTITGNRASYGGGIASAIADLQLLHSTVAGNTGSSGTGGVVTEIGSATIENSILAANKNPAGSNDDLGGSGSAVTVGGKNLLGNNASPYAALFPADGILIGTAANPVDPHLAPPSFYGGCTPTMQPLAPSPSFDAGIASGTTPATDQRGLARLVGPPDLGAVESGPRITVLNTNDSGGGSLRQAIIDALPNPGTRIYFDSGAFPASIDFGSQISISGQHVFIDASDLPAPVTLNGQSSTRLFVFANSVVGFVHLSLVKADSGAVSGGAVRTSGSDLTCYRTTFADNLTGDDGAAILLFNGGSVNLHESLVADNTAADLGGGIMSFFGDVTAVNTTFTGNQAGGGAAAWVQGASATNLNHATLTGNTGAQTVVSFGTNTIENTIIAGNSATNLAGVGTTTFRGNNFLAGDPWLAPLNNFSGPTFTMPPLPGSPVIEGAVLLGTTPCTDQRGLARPNGPLPDTGAAEAHAFSLLPLVDTDNDGIDDRLEPAYPQLTVGVDDSGLDTDGDGRTDATELGDMTDPLDPTDLFRILSIQTAAGYVPDSNPVFDLTVDTFPGLTYEFEGGNALNNFLPFVPDSTFTADDFETSTELTLMPGKDFARAGRK